MRKYSNNRSGRIADQIHKDIVVILRSKVKDPRVSWITINDVEVDQEYSTARIYWSILDETKIDGATKALESAKGFIRSELSKGFKTYTIPHIKFIYDESISRGAKILNVINQVSQEFSTDEIDNDNNPST
ncbi:MAG: 30S ribosome-binding factor RbfA [Proteobacteria bacterium]|jgi:ribosome-binding factor A|nr:30S ribosome-binding factor RbfA [Pseudomonadota bacterium]